MDVARNCLSHWFPKLLAAGVPVPRTEVIRADPGWINRELYRQVTEIDIFTREAFLDKLTDAAARLGHADGRPVFMRTGQFSGKHNFENCCFVRTPADLWPHVLELAEYSEMVSFIGLPYDVWVVREYLPVSPVCALPRYGNMPLVPEYRYFVKDGGILCCHHYWPLRDVRRGLNEADAAASARVYKDATAFPLPHEADAVALSVARAFAGDGCWSVDVLAADGRVYVTDMAVGGESYHWPGCPNGGTVEDGREPAHS